MKKVLSVILAMLMLCSVFAVPSFAADTEPVVTPPSGGFDWWTRTTGDRITSGPIANKEQVMVVFALNGGTLKSNVYIYDFNTNEFVYSKGSDVKGTYYMVPVDSGAQKGGSSIQLPAVTPKAGYQFDGWMVEKYDPAIESSDPDVVAKGQSLGANSMFKLPEADYLTVYFSAVYSSAEDETPTLQKVLGILIKVFATILATFTDKTSEYWIAYLNEMLAGILG